MKHLIAFVPALLVAGLAMAAPSTADTVGAVIVARASGNALVVWQATPFVAMLTGKRETENQALAELETAALQVIADRKPALRRASSIALKVMYVKSGLQNDPRYAPTSFAGFQQLLVLTASKSALAQSARWPKVVDPSHLPAGVTATVTGKIYG